MPQPIRIAISGAAGRMGRALVERVRADRRLRLQAAVVKPGSDLVGRPIRLPDMPDTLRFAAGWADVPALDVVIDFSTPSGLGAALEYCQASSTGLVAGTTGIDDALERQLKVAGEHIAVLRAANFSLGVALLTRLLSEAAAALPDWDLEIIEAHHGRKQDAPSGTALSLGTAAATARGIDLADAAVYAREGTTGARKTGSIGFASVRGGDIVGEHTALLATTGERLELIHRATDRGIFARGALQAAIWLVGQQPGNYSISDVLDDRAP